MPGIFEYERVEPGDSALAGLDDLSLGGAVAGQQGRAGKPERPHEVGEQAHGLAARVPQEPATSGSESRVSARAAATRSIGRASRSLGVRTTPRPGCHTTQRWTVRQPAL